MSIKTIEISVPGDVPSLVEIEGGFGPSIVEINQGSPGDIGAPGPNTITTATTTDLTGVLVGDGSTVGTLGFTPADDAAVVHLAGEETVSGLKKFTGGIWANTVTASDGVAVLSMEGNGGSINTGNSGGSINTNLGGDIDTHNNGGYIKTKNGGGGIDTNLGFVEFGVLGSRTTLQNTATADREISLPDESGTLATRAYADSLVVGLLDDRGNYSASGNVFPSSGGSGTAGAILKGDLWTISVAGTLGGVAVTAGDVLRSKADTPGQTAGNWVITENNLGYVAQNTAGTLALAGFSGITGTLAISNIGGLGTGVATALVVNIGSAGAFVTTSSADTLTNKTLTTPTINGYTEGVTASGTVTTTATLSISSGTLLTATLTASTACIFTMPTATAGKSFTLLLKQAAATGNGTATFTGVKWPAATAPTITATAGKMDILTFFSDGTNWYGSITQNFTP